MKVFLFYVGPPTPILETELELIRNHEKAGDTVRVLQCTGALRGCHWNPVGSRAQCAACRSKFSNGWSVLAPGVNVELRAFPVMQDFELPNEFESVEDMTQYRHDGEKIGFGVASGLVSVFRDHRFDAKANRKTVTRALRASIHVYETLKREFLQSRPDRVYIFNGRIGTHLPAYLLCKRMGIEFVSYEVAAKPNSYRAVKNRRVHDPISAEEVESLRSLWTKEHQDRAESVVRGRRLGKTEKIPVFTADQVSGLLPEGFDSTRRNIAIFASTIDEYAGIEGWGNPLYQPDETTGVDEMAQALAADPRFMIYLRVHPNMKEMARTTSQLADIRRMEPRHGNLRVIWPEDDVDSYALMDACEKVVTFGSTMGLEATYWGRPSILAGRAFYENFDCTYRPRSHEELVSMLQAHLAPRPARAALLYFYWEVSHGIPFSYFQETGFKRGLATGTFDGVEIRADKLATLRHEIARFLRGVMKALMTPSQAWLMLKGYAKTIH